MWSLVNRAHPACCAAIPNRCRVHESCAWPTIATARARASRGGRRGAGLAIADEIAHRRGVPVVSCRPAHAHRFKDRALTTGVGRRRGGCHDQVCRMEKPAVGPVEDAMKGSDVLQQRPTRVARQASQRYRIRPILAASAGTRYSPRESLPTARQRRPQVVPP